MRAWLMAASSSMVLDLGYSYASANNGNIASQANNLSGETGRKQDYTYDSLNRRLTAQSQATSGGDCWGQGFGNNATPPTAATDALANLFYTSSTKCSTPAPQYTGDGSNHISTSGFSYDYAGNNTADTFYSYTYDAENRIQTASGMSGGPYCYAYDGDGVRVARRMPAAAPARAPSPWMCSTGAISPGRQSRRPIRPAAPATPATMSMSSSPGGGWRGPILRREAYTTSSWTRWAARAS